MASFSPMPPCAGTAPFEVGVRPHCSRTQSSRGRQQQCVRSAARHSSRFASRGSSAGSRSRRPSSEVELRSELRSTPAAATAVSCDESRVDECAVGLVSGVINIAMDDIATEIDYFSEEEMTGIILSSDVCSAEQVLSVSEPTIAEESEDNEEISVAFSEVAEEDASAFLTDVYEAMDEAGICEFDDDVCSMASENPDGLDEVDDMLIAEKFAKSAASDETIREALAVEEDRGFNLCSLFFNGIPIVSYTSDILQGAKAGAVEELSKDEWEDEGSLVSDNEDAQEACVEFLGEGAFLGEDLASDFTSCILDGAIVQAADTWDERAKLEASTQPVQNERSLEEVKEDARQVLLKAAMDKQQLESPAPQVTELELLKQMARECLVKAARSLRSASADAPEAPAELEDSIEEDLWDCAPSECCPMPEGLGSPPLAPQEAHSYAPDEATDLRKKVQATLLKAAASGVLQSALGRYAQNIQPTSVAKPAECEEAVETNNCDVKALRQVLVEATASGKLQAALRELVQKEDNAAQIQKQSEEMPATSKDRNLHSSRSRRRVIGGVVRTPTLQDDIAATPASPRKHSKSTSRAAAQGHVSFSMEANAEDDSIAGRSSSLTRSYDTLGVQFYNLADADEALHTAKALSSSGSSRKPSKARAKLQAASVSAMAMDLGDGPSSASTPAPAAMYNFDQFASGCVSFTPTPLKLGQKMRPSSSMGSLNLDQQGSYSFAKAKQVPGLLPILNPGKNSAESIAWSMQVSKTQSKWRNTGLRGSASMIF